MQDEAARIVWDCPWWRVEVQPFTGPDGVERQWYTARRPNPHTVHMLAITAEGLTPVLRQWRLPLKDYVWELPAGLCDKPGEDLEAAAARELLEETGFRARQLHHLFCGTVSPGLTDELYNAFLCLDLVRENAGGGTGGEQLEVHLLPFQELQRFMLEQADHGAWVDAKVFTHITLAIRKISELKRADAGYEILKPL